MSSRTGERPAPLLEIGTNYGSGNITVEQHFYESARNERSRFRSTKDAARYAAIAILVGLFMPAFAPVTYRPALFYGGLVAFTALVVVAALAYREERRLDRLLAAEATGAATLSATAGTALAQEGTSALGASGGTAFAQQGASALTASLATPVAAIVTKAALALSVALAATTTWQAAAASLRATPPATKPSAAAPASQPAPRTDPFEGARHEESASAISTSDLVDGSSPRRADLPGQPSASESEPKASSGVAPKTSRSSHAETKRVSSHAADLGLGAAVSLGSKDSADAKPSAAVPQDASVPHASPAETKPSVAPAASSTHAHAASKTLEVTRSYAMPTWHTYSELTDSNHQRALEDLLRNGADLWESVAGGSVASSGRLRLVPQLCNKEHQRFGATVTVWIRPDGSVRYAKASTPIPDQASSFDEALRRDTLGCLLDDLKNARFTVADSVHSVSVAFELQNQ